jgi:hypothetical protein
MASDGTIDPREVDVIKTLCEKSPLFVDFDIHTELNTLVKKINAEGKKFIADYLNSLQESTLTEKEELTLLDFAIQTMYADDVLEYSEIKFFKTIRHRLHTSDEKILEHFADVRDIEMFVGEDIIVKDEGFLEKISALYLDSAELPQFEAIKLSKE